MYLLHVSLRVEYQCLSYSLCLYYTFHYWYKTPQVYDTFIVFFYMFYFLKLVLHCTCLSIGIFDRTFWRFIWLICDIFSKDKVLVINALSIIKKICTNAEILEQLCLLTKLLPLSKFKYRWDFYGGKHS